MNMTATIWALAAIGISFTIGVFWMRIAGVPLTDELAAIAQAVAVISPIILGLLAALKANQVERKTDDNKQAVGVVARVAVDGFAGPPAAKAEAVKALNGTLPAPGSPEAKRPEAQEAKP